MWNVSNGADFVLSVSLPTSLMQLEISEQLLYLCEVCETENSDVDALVSVSIHSQFHFLHYVLVATVIWNAVRKERFWWEKEGINKLLSPCLVYSPSRISGGWTNRQPWELIWSQQAWWHWLQLEPMTKQERKGGRVVEDIHKWCPLSQGLDKHALHWRTGK